MPKIPEMPSLEEILKSIEVLSRAGIRVNVDFSTFPGTLMPPATPTIRVEGRLVLFGATEEQVRDILLVITKDS